MKSRVAVSEYDGVVELNSIYFPKIRKYKGYAHPAAFVSNINRYSLPLDQEIVGGLKWPDPLTDWLIAIGPHLLRMDLVDVVGAALEHVNKTILDYLSERFQVWWMRTCI